MLRKNSLLIPGNYKADDPYNLIDYLRTAHEKDCKFQVLFDRNLLTRLVYLAKGKRVPSDAASAKVLQLSAACLAFCILAQILVEPNMSLYEYASSSSHEEAVSDYRYFQIADNVDPKYYIDIALGRVDRLPKKHLADLQHSFNFSSLEVAETDFERTLNLWKPNYLFVLKTACLLRSGLNPITAANALLQWEASEAFYNAAASLFCLAAISHKPPSGGMIKKIRSSSASELRRGIRNATWDICIISQWGKWIRQEEKIFWALSSNDIALRTIAQALFIGVQESSASKICEFLNKHWGKHDGGQLAKTYISYSNAAQLNPQQRTLHVELAFSKVDQWIWQLEKELGIEHTT
jgi:hypothetical protein